MTGRVSNGLGRILGGLTGSRPSVGSGVRRPAVGDGGGARASGRRTVRVPSMSRARGCTPPRSPAASPTPVSAASGTTPSGARPTANWVTSMSVGYGYAQERSLRGHRSGRSKGRRSSPPGCGGAAVGRAPPPRPGLVQWPATFWVTWRPGAVPPCAENGEKPSRCRRRCAVVDGGGRMRRLPGAVLVEVLVDVLVPVLCAAAGPELPQAASPRASRTALRQGHQGGRREAGTHAPHGGTDPADRQRRGTGRVWARLRPWEAPVTSPGSSGDVWPRCRSTRSPTRFRRRA